MINSMCKYVKLRCHAKHPILGGTIIGLKSEILTYTCGIKYITLLILSLSDKLIVRNHAAPLML